MRYRAKLRLLVCGLLVAPLVAHGYDRPNLVGNGRRLIQPSRSAQVSFSNGLRNLEAGRVEDALADFRAARAASPEESVGYRIEQSRSSALPVPYLPTLFILFAECERMTTGERKVERGWWSADDCHCSPEVAMRLPPPRDPVQLVGAIEVDQVCHYFCTTLDCAETCRHLVDKVRAATVPRS